MLIGEQLPAVSAEEILAVALLHLDSRSATQEGNIHTRVVKNWSGHMNSRCSFQATRSPIAWKSRSSLVEEGSEGGAMYTVVNIALQGDIADAEVVSTVSGLVDREGNIAITGRRVAHL
jgi:hypothetical protein